MENNGLIISDKLVSSVIGILKGRRGMKTLRIVIICALTAAVVLAICAPALLNGILPEAVLNAASLDEFPLLGACSQIARQLVTAIRGQEHVTLDIVTNALGDGFLDELLSLLMVAVLSIPVSLALGFALYKPLYKGLLAKGFLYASLNLCSVMIAWILYRQIYFRLLIEGLITNNINDQTLQTVVNYLTQFLSVAAFGTLAVKIAVAAVAAHVTVHRVVLPLIGTLIRTLLFAFFVALMLLLGANPAEWSVIIPMMLATLIVSAAVDGVFGS